MTAMSKDIEYGSSPRTWGTPTLTPFSDRPTRFIPKYMGNAQPAGMQRKDPAVHPHVHGERNAGDRIVLNGIGSSPRTWGTQRSGPRSRSLVRFIPTYMGNARSLGRFRCFQTVHPHVHGERSSNFARSPLSSGSSPRTWGTHRWIL